MNKSFFYILFVIGISLRFFHFGEELLEPHVWRQSDTANYIWDFYENGINLFYPSVCWMGGHKTLILEFPLVEAIASIGYHIFGPYQIVAKIVFFLFYLLSCYYFFKLIAYLYNSQIARLSLLFYILAPLSLFYSTAIHIDFAELAFVFGMSYHFLKGIKEELKVHLIVGSLFATLAFLTKVPYVLPLLLPIIAFVFINKKLKYILRNFYFIIIPVLIFVLWQNHVYAVNDKAPDWHFIPGYRKFTYNAGWYYGSLDQRLTLSNWTLIKDRLFYEIIGYSGLFLLIISFIILKKRNYFIVFWLLGTVFYLLIFFNLNIVHNYYQTPFVPIFSVFMGLGLFKLITYLFRGKQALTLSLVFLIFGIEQTYYSEKNYYQEPNTALEIGYYINKHTDKNDLIIINYDYIDAKCPIYLYASRRNGWQLNSYKLSGSIIDKLILEKASYFFSIRSEPPVDELKNYLSSYPLELQKLSNGKVLYMYDLKVPARDQLLLKKDV